jgi:hypothetical protein
MIFDIIFLKNAYISMTVTGLLLHEKMPVTETYGD